MEGVLRLQLEQDVHAGMLITSGAVPATVLDLLSRADLDWTRIDVGLVDEVWVEQSHPRSRAGQLVRTLFQNQAASAHFLPMKTPDETAEAGAERLQGRYGRLMDLGPMVLLDLDTRGQTAAWVPKGGDWDLFLDPENEHAVAALEPPVGDDRLERVSVTGRALDAASVGLLYITGDEARRLFENRQARLPIHVAEEILGERLVTVWAP